MVIMLRRGLLVLLVAACLSCIQASRTSAQHREAGEGNEKPAVETEDSTVHPVNSYGSIYFDYGENVPSYDYHRSKESVANDGNVREAVVGAKFKSGLTQPQKFFDPDNQPARPTHRRSKQGHRGAGQEPTPDSELISRSEYNQQFYFLQTQIYTLQQSIDDIRHHLNQIAQAVGNLKNSHAT